MINNINLICAVSYNGIIGDSTSNSIPWHLKGDLAHFKEVTKYSNVVMGYNTFKSIGKPLKDRRNIVLTNTVDRRNELLNSNIDAIYGSMYSIYINETGQTFVIGGQNVFKSVLYDRPVDITCTLYLTLISSIQKGDVFLPVTCDICDFLCDNVDIGNDKYMCNSRSNWHTENGLMYQFVKFSQV